MTDGLLARFDAAVATLHSGRSRAQFLALRPELVRAIVPPPPPVVPPVLPPPPAIPVPPVPLPPWGVTPAGWALEHSTTFDEPVPLGAWHSYDQAPVAAYPYLKPYSDGWADTNGKPIDKGGRGGSSRYEPSTVLEVSGGRLVAHLHNDGAGERSAALVVGGNQVSGRYFVEFRADALPGFKTAFLLWPDKDENWPRMGEVDFPEGSLNGTIGGFMHRQDATWGGDQDFAATGARYTDRHTALIEWVAGQRVTYVLDGLRIAEWTSRVPKGPMHWVLQLEANIGGERAPKGTRGVFEIFSLAMWSKV